MIVREVMRQAYATDRNISFRDAAKILCSKNIGCLIVVSGNKIRGIVTERDILRNFNNRGKIFSIMKKKVLTVGPDVDIDDVLAVLKQNKIKRLPVVDGYKLIGIITLTDIAAHSGMQGGEFFL